MPASLILNEHSMSAVRYQRNFSSNNPTSRITSLRNAIRYPSIASTSGPSLSWNSRRSSVEIPNGPQTPTPRSSRARARALERREHVPGRFDRSVHHEHGPATRTPEPRVQGGAPSRPCLEREDLDVRPVGRGLRLGDVRDDVPHVSAPPVRAE